MTIEITRPELETLINQRLQSGAFKDAEDVILQALQCSIPGTAPPRATSGAEARDMVELFAPLRGFNMTFERDRDTGRDIEL